MKQLTCEMCGNVDLCEQDGYFVCQYCGCKYSDGEAKRMAVEGVVKIDNSDELKNLYRIARRARNDNNVENAARYYDMILIKDPESWEAYFYQTYCRAMDCKIAEIQSAAKSVSNCIGSTFKLIKDKVEDKDIQKLACAEVALRVTDTASALYNAAINHFQGIDSSIRYKYYDEVKANAMATINCFYTLGDKLDAVFGADAWANELAVTYWKQGVEMNKPSPLDGKDEKGKNIVNDYIEKIKKYDESYALAQANTGGCYVATCVYGSYDCPQVWTLRRYRDYTLGATWYGRLFIKFYYAVSPTLVKWFGETQWFKKMWRGKLDRMVKKLKDNGVEDTPYDDIEW